MQRRSFFQRALSGFVAFCASRKARAQGVRLESFHELARVVLPSSLSPASTDKIAADFVRWFRDYKPGAEISGGYGHPRTQVTGPDPSANYADQMRALGSPVTRGAVEKALANAKIDRIPGRPDGKHGPPHSAPACVLSVDNRRPSRTSLHSGNGWSRRSIL